MSVHGQDSAYLRALFGFFWVYKYLIAASAIAGAATAIFLALTATPIYRAEVVVTEAADGGAAGLGAFSDQFSGLASLAGISLGPRAGLGQEARAILQSRQIVEEFIKRHDLVAALLRDSEQVTLWNAVETFRQGVLTITENRTKGTILISIDWMDPSVAAQWANDFVSLANDLVRTRALNQATRNIEYLNEQLAKTNVVEVRRAMYNLIENETKTLMFANGRSEFAFTVVDPAVPPERRIRPRRTVMAVLGLLGGFFGGIVLAVVHTGLSKSRESPRAA